MRLRNIILLSAAIRIILAPLTWDEFNLWTFISFVDFALMGYNPWSAAFRLGLRVETGTPSLTIVMVTLVRIAEIYSKIPSYILIKIPTITADIISIYFFYKIALMMIDDDKTIERLTLLFGLNPMLIFVSSITITDDSLAIACTVISLYYFLSAHRLGNQLFAKTVISAYFLGLGAAVKLYPLLLAPAFMAKLRGIKRMVIFAFFTGLPLLLFSLPFLIWDFTSYSRGIMRFHIAPPVAIVEVVRQTRPLYSLWWIIADFVSATPDFLWLLNQLAVISLGISFLLLFIFMRSEKTSVIINVTLLFLVLYVFLFRVSPHYYVFILPFAYLLSADSGLKKPFRGLRLLPNLLWVPTLVLYMLVTGQYGELGGRQLYSRGAGVFHFFYPSLGLDLFPWKILNLEWSAIWRFTIAINLIICAYFIVNLILCVKPFRVRMTMQLPFKSKVMSRGSKHVKLSLLITPLMIASFIPYSIFLEESQNSTGDTGPPIFFDDFSSSALSFHWFWNGEGVYTLHHHEAPSYILLDTRGTLKRSFIGQYIYGIDPPRVLNTSGYIEFRFKLIEFAQNATKMIISRSDGSLFLVDRVEVDTVKRIDMDTKETDPAILINDTGSNYVYNFIFIDTVEEDVRTLAQADDSWHTFKIGYNTSGRYLYLDNVYKGSMPTLQGFTYLTLGNSDRDDAIGGVVAIDWVSIEIDNLENPNHGKVALAFGAPAIIVIIIGVMLCYWVKVGNKTLNKRK